MEISSTTEVIPDDEGQSVNDLQYIQESLGPLVPPATTTANNANKLLTPQPTTASSVQQEEMEESDSSSDSDSDDEELIVEGADSGEEDSSAFEIPRTKNEIVKPPIQAIDITLTEEHKLEEIGAVAHVVESSIVIQSSSAAKALDLDSILWLEDKTALGRVEEVFGPVTQPYYSVPFDTSNQRLAALTPGTKVYHVPELSSYVAAEQIRTKGSDASGEFDEEPPPEDLEYSDDEEEAQAKKLLKTKRKTKQKKKRATQQTGQPLNGNSNMQTQQQPVNELYEPLQRPHNFLPPQHSTALPYGQYPQHAPYHPPVYPQQPQYQQQVPQYQQPYQPTAQYPLYQNTPYMQYPPTQYAPPYHAYYQQMSVPYQQQTNALHAQPVVQSAQQQVHTQRNVQQQQQVNQQIDFFSAPPLLQPVAPNRFAAQSASTTPTQQSTNKQ